MLAPDNEFIAEDPFAREDRNDFADHAESRKDHYIYGRMGVEPEKMLEQERIASDRRIEHANVENAFERQQQKCHRQNRSRKHQDDAGGIKRPQEDRHLEPGHAGCAQAMDGDDEVQSGRNRRKACDKDRHDRGHDVSLRIGGGERGIEGPARVDAANE